MVLRWFLVYDERRNLDMLINRFLLKVFFLDFGILHHKKYPHALDFNEICTLCDVTLCSIAICKSDCEYDCSFKFWKNFERVLFLYEFSYQQFLQKLVINVINVNILETKCAY